MPPFETEEKLITFLDKIEDEGSNARGDIVKRTRENMDLVRGKQWKGSESPYFLYNVIESAIEDKTGKLSETKPKFNVMPYRNGLDDVAKILTQVTSGMWDKRKVEYQTERIAAWGAISGVAFVGTPYNPALDHGLGDVDFVVKDPRACGIDVSIVDATKTDVGEYIYCEDFLPLDIIRAQYPGRGALVEPDERISGFKDSKPTDTRTMLRAAYERLANRINKGDNKSSVIPKAILKEYYIQDRRESIDDVGVIPIVSGITNWARGGKPFPGGRRILRAGNTILEDTYNPYWDGLPPIDMLSWKIDLETAWAGDDVAGVKRLQEAVNRLGDAYTKTAIINGIIRLVMDAGALSPDERNKLSNEVGQIIVKNPGRSLEYQVPPLLSSDVLACVDKFVDYIRRKTGTQQMPAEKDIPSIITGPAIEGLQMMVETPIRTAARRIEELYQRVGQKLISRVFQYYTADRMIQLVGPSQQWTSFEFERKKILVDQKGNPRPQEDIQKAYRDFYFAVEPGSSLAITKAARVGALAMFVQMGIMHPEQLLLEAGFLNAKDIIKRAQEAREGGLFDTILQAGNKSNMGQAVGKLAA